MPSQPTRTGTKQQYNGKHLHIITGQLASTQVRRVVEKIQKQTNIQFSIQPLPISVASLITTTWIEKHFQAPSEVDVVLLPGNCKADLNHLSKKYSVPFILGPTDILDLGAWLGGKVTKPELDQWDVEIIAEINFAGSLTLEQITAQAIQLSRDGADLIDIGCTPGKKFLNLGDTVQKLTSLGLKVSVDSLDPEEIVTGCRAGASLILSVNNQNFDQIADVAKDHNTELVAIPDSPDNFASLQSLVEKLEKKEIRYRIDPILEPLGLGFSESLFRYKLARKTWPNAELMMGTGNLSELSDVDSAGINFLLLGICQELGIRSVLTTQVINWASTSVKEIDIARRIHKHSQSHSRPPKRISDQLVCLRDDRLKRETKDNLLEMSAAIKDKNLRIQLLENKIACIGKNNLWTSADPFEIFDQLQESLEPKDGLSPSHSFYLGFEMCKAMIAQQLGKNYTQDQALKWGYLTQEETDRHRLEK